MGAGSNSGPGLISHNTYGMAISSPNVISNITAGHIFTPFDVAVTPLPDCGFPKFAVHIMAAELIMVYHSFCSYLLKS